MVYSTYLGQLKMIQFDVNPFSNQDEILRIHLCNRDRIYVRIKAKNELPLPRGIWV